MRKKEAVIEVVRRSSLGISMEHRKISVDRVVSSDDKQSYLFLPNVRPPSTGGTQYGTTRTRGKTHY